MKIKVVFLLFIITIIPFFSGCLKHTTEDPFISFLTRRERLTGKWKLVKYENTFFQNGSNGHGGVNYDYFFDGSYMIEKFSGETCCKPSGYPYFDTTFTHTYSYSLDLTIERNGSYTTETNKAGGISSISDKWNLETTKPKKIKIKFNSWSDFDIDRLSNKEMILTINYEGFYPHRKGNAKWVFEKQ